MKMIRLLGAALLCLFSSNAFAASKLFVSEYSTLATTNSGGSQAQIGSEPNVADQVVDFSGGAAASAAFNANTRFVRLQCDTRCAIRVTTAGTAATTSNKPLAADSPEYFGVLPGDKVSVIASP